MRQVGRESLVLPFFAVRPSLVYMSIFFWRLKRMSHQFTPGDGINIGTAPLYKLVEIFAPTVEPELQ